MAANITSSNIKVYQKKKHLNIGIAIFGVIFIYLLVTVLMYLTAKRISVYEVREGSIVKDTSYTGLAIRNETVVHSKGKGYVNYFISEGNKVGAKTQVYSLSDQKLQFETNTNNTQKLTSSEQSAISQKTQTFCENYTDGTFGDVYTLKNNISGVLEGKSNQNRQTQIAALTESDLDGLKVYTAESDGIISYSVDGFENTKADDITPDMLNKENYNKKEQKNNTKIKSGDSVYKLIKDDDWTLVIALSKQSVKDLTDASSVQVRFPKDNETMTAAFSMKKVKGTWLGYLAFDNSMVRYAQDRFVDVELIMADHTGLKIPKSAVTKKNFYVISEDYLTQGGNSNSTGVLIDTGKENAQFQSVDIYYRDTSTGSVYIDPDDFEENTTLRKPDSSDTCQLNKTRKLKGVYNINRGYAVFRQVQILCESDEYYIVQSGDDYGLSNYDHIALTGKDVHEGDVIS